MLPTIKTLFKPVWSLVLGYILIRVLSFTTYGHPMANEIIAGFLIGAFVYICIKNLKLAWLILVGELLLDGAGHFFEWQNLLLRTWWLGIFGLVWFISKIKHRDFKISLPRPILISLIGVGLMLAWSTINGFIHNHAAIYILQDAILFCFLLLLFPALEFAKEAAKTFTTMIKAFIAGSAIFSLITFFIYSSGLGYLPDTFYHWFRNVASGKITDLGNNFFRIVLPEHLFIVPIILVIATYLMNQPKNRKLWGLLLCCLFILTLNFSRIYFLGLTVGLLVLTIKNPLKKWFTVSAVTFASMLIIFSSTHFIASRGQSFGLELLGLRTTGTTNLSGDTSGAIRLAILPDALHQIRAQPWFGSGLGATITYTDPATKQLVTRTQFDWGYFEMLAELGIVGTLIFFVFYFTVLYHLARLAYHSNSDSILARGLLAGLIALGVINITTPALFHGFGTIYIVLTLVTIYKNQH